MLMLAVASCKGFTDIFKNRTSLGVKDLLPDWQAGPPSQQPVANGQSVLALAISHSEVSVPQTVWYRLLVWGSIVKSKDNW